jgi:hypothetical protein
VGCFECSPKRKIEISNRRISFFILSVLCLSGATSVAEAQNL